MSDTTAPTESSAPGRPFSTIRVGLAGWSYADWRGTFYPEPRPRGFRELRYAAERFDCLEINNTFYRLPEAGLSDKWQRETEDLPDFAFTAKLHRSLTHEKVSIDDARKIATRFREGLKPLNDRARLRAVLVQFPWFVEASRGVRELLLTLSEALAPLELAIEVRHRSFLDPGAAGMLRFFEEHGLGFVNIDLPRSPTAPPPTCVSTSALGYFRLHGRNHTTWFDRDAGRDARYDYLYRPDELASLLSPIRRVAAHTDTTVVITNNHYRGQAAANAFQLLRLLGRETPHVPPSLQQEFPFLGRPVEPRRERDRGP